MTAGAAGAEPAPAPTEPAEPAPAGRAAPTTAPTLESAENEADAEAKALDDLLGRLAKTREPAAAKRVAGAIQRLWRRSGSDTVDLLTARATDAQRKAKIEVALKLLDEVVSLKPDFAEGWNRRATLNFLAKNYDAAMADLHETLLREPRHFGAWLGLGRILREVGQDRQALGAYRRVLEIYPAIEGVKRNVEELALKVEGRPI